VPRLGGGGGGGGDDAADAGDVSLKLNWDAMGLSPTNVKVTWPALLTQNATINVEDVEAPFQLEDINNGGGKFILIEKITL